MTVDRNRLIGDDDIFTDPVYNISLRKRKEARHGARFMNRNTVYKSTNDKFIINDYAFNTMTIFFCCLIYKFMIIKSKNEHNYNK